jgi:hypothetical protein
MGMKNIDLSQEQIGTVFYTRNYSEAKLIERIGSDLYRFEVDTFNTFDTQTRIYNKRGNIIQADMRRSHPLDLIEKQ